MLDLDQIQTNWNKILTFIETAFEGERQERLLKLYNDYENRIAVAPASSRIHFHSCFDGGYIHHVLNVLRIAPKVSNLWESIGGKKVWTDEELAFVALNHDLGKIGDLEHEHYLPTTEEWKIKRGTKYDVNSDMEFMKVQDCSLFLLQHYGIRMTKNEFMAIQLHDGLYDDGNKPYYTNPFGLKNHEVSRFVHVIHTADLLATKQEYEEWTETPEGKQFLQGESKLKPKTIKGKKTLEKALNGETLKHEDIKVTKFEDLFGDVFGDKK